MSYNLYPYQIESKNQLREGFMQHKRQLLVLPTGAGKTIVFSDIVQSAVQRGTLTLVLTDRLQLLTQATEAIEKIGIPVAKIDSKNKYIHPNAKMYVGMVQTFLRRLEKLEHIPFQLIVIDEAHMAIFNKILDTWPTTRVIGATATPIGKHLYKYYTNMVNCIDTPDLVKQGFLTPCRSWQMEDDFSDVKKTSKGEFDESSLYKHYDKAKLYDGVIMEWLEMCMNQQTIVFNVNVEHTIKMTAAFNAAGIKSYCIHSKMPDDEIKWVMAEYARGSFPVLNNCGILTKGYSEDKIRWVIINRATDSIALYLQMCGRGSRLLAGKQFFGIIDFGMNIKRHGLWDQPRTWSLEPPKVRKAALGAAPIKSCPKCDAMIPAVSRLCNYCGYIFLPTEKELAQGRLVELTNKIRSGVIGRYVSQLTIPELIECEKTKQLKAVYVWRILRNRGETAITQYAEMKQYRSEWVMRQLEAREHEGHVPFSDKKINEIEMMKLS